VLRSISTTAIRLCSLENPANVDECIWRMTYC
jgi:hypothetical protein